MKRWRIWLPMVIAVLVCVVVVLLDRQPHYTGVYRQVDESRKGMTLVVDMELTKSGAYKMTETRRSDGLPEIEGSSPMVFVVDEGTYTIEGETLQTKGTMGTFSWTLHDGVLKKPGFSLRKVD